MGAINRLQEVLHLFIFFGIDRVIELVNEKVIVLLLSLFLLLFESSEIFLAFLHSLFRNQVEGCRHLF